MNEKATTMPLHTVRGTQIGGTDGEPDTLSIRPEFAQRGEMTSIPKLKLARTMLPADTAYELVQDELLLDDSSRLNLATFVTTWMESQARMLIEHSLDKNIVDRDESPQTAELELRCVNILAHMWHAPRAHAPTGCSTAGSSEACMLGGLALKWRWREQRRASEKSSEQPNLVMGANVQVCWEKFCRYWDVEPRKMQLEPGRTCLTPDQAAALCDENTIGVVAILGSTLDGRYEPVADISAALDDLQSRTGLDVPIHVDAASGGFVAPFLDRELEWDFRLPRVQSINASGHKYGLVYPNVGWLLWRNRAALPEDLIFEVNYLGGLMPTFSLNFSRAGSPVVAQYYTMIRLGWEGFRRIQQACRDTAEWLAEEVSKLGPFVLLSDGSEIPASAFRLADDVAGYTVFDVSDRLRDHHWQVPAYTLPANLQDTAVLRFVIRNGFGRDLAQLFAQDLRRATTCLARAGAMPPRRHRTAFHH